MALDPTFAPTYDLDRAFALARRVVRGTIVEEKADAIRDFAYLVGSVGNAIDEEKGYGDPQPDECPEDLEATAAALLEHEGYAGDPDASPVNFLVFRLLSFLAPILLPLILGDEEPGE